MAIRYTAPERDQYKSIRITSRYLTMRDGTRLAVDVYFPEPYDFRKPLPVLLHQTRYWRSTRFKAPFRWFLSPFQGSAGRLVKEIVMSGYAIVNVDARGSGASFGTRAHPWTAAEVDDGYEIVDWIIDQPWSNGKVGAVGISYTGTAAEFLASRQHPAVKAYMPLFSLYDIFDDIALPGGIPHEGFLSCWGSANAMLDSNQNPLPYRLAKLLVAGVRPVHGQQHELAAALAEHQGNMNVDDTSRGVLFRDQAPGNKIVETMDEFSPHAFLEPINAGGAAFLSGSGWFDGAYQHAAIKRFLNLDLPYNKLVIGAWSHGGRWHTSPGYSGPNKDDLAGLALHYFDHFLKGHATPASDTPRVQYFTMQQEQWKSAEEWPPKAVQMAPLFLEKEGKLSTNRPNTMGVYDLEHNPLSGTGEATRWRALVGLVPTHKYYPDRAERTRQLLHFDTAPLASALEVTGHPVVELWISTQEEDGSFFVYLDDVAPNGEVRYVTEGLLRASHRQENAAEPVYRDCVPQRSYRKGDARRLDSGVHTLLRFDLLPTSYLFREGHRIRVSIATADRDNFGDLNRAGSRYGIHWGKEFSSQIWLPVMPR